MFNIMIKKHGIIYKLSVEDQKNNLCRNMYIHMYKEKKTLASILNLKRYMKLHNRLPFMLP